MKIPFLQRRWTRIWDLEAENLKLQEAVMELTNEKLRLQDRLDTVIEDRKQLWDLMRKSIDEMKIAYQSHINMQWQKQGAGVPYPEAPHLPASAVPVEQSHEPIGRRGRMLPSEAQNRAAMEFVTNWANKVNKG
jgi:hypothetical protein